MSNVLSVRRVRVQELNEDGTDSGAPSFGVLASDDNEQGFIDIYESRDELEAAIAEAPSILALVGGFDSVNHEKIGKDNYFGPYPGDDADEDAA
jgi:hypothetical protein